MCASDRRPPQRKSRRRDAEINAEQFQNPS